MGNPGEKRFEALRTYWSRELQQRSLLHQEIVRADRVAPLLAEMAQGNSAAADLCGAIGNEQCTRALLSLLAAQPQDELAWFGLCVRHVAHPDALLADCTLRHLSQGKSSLPTRSPHDLDTSLFPPIITALACYPVGLWVDALLALCDVDDSAAVVLGSLAGSLNAEDKRRVSDYCWQLLRQQTRYGLIHLALALDGSAEEVSARLRELPYEPPPGANEPFSDKEEVLAFRQRLVQMAVDRREGREPKKYF